MHTFNKKIAICHFCFATWWAFVQSWNPAEENCVIIKLIHYQLFYILDDPPTPNKKRKKEKGGGHTKSKKLCHCLHTISPAKPLMAYGIQMNKSICLEGLGYFFLRIPNCQETLEMCSFLNHTTNII